MPRKTNTLSHSLLLSNTWAICADKHSLIRGQWFRGVVIGTRTGRLGQINFVIPNDTRFLEIEEAGGFASLCQTTDDCAVSFDNYSDSYFGIRWDKHWFVAEQPGRNEKLFSVVWEVQVLASRCTKYPTRCAHRHPSEAYRKLPTESLSLEANKNIIIWRLKLESPDG